MQDLPPRSNLPFATSSFVGREREIAEIRRLLAGARFLTLTGPGGCGKTRLALEVAGKLAEDFKDGLCWVELASLSDPELVEQRVASALGVREAPGRPMTDLLVGRLKPEQTLLLLDNCEHLIEACAALISALLRACPELKVLATSREALNVPGETVRVVPPLSVPDPGDEPSAGVLSGYEAARLFVERAEAASRFALTQENAAAVARICRILDGVPLAIELAAAKTRVLSATRISIRLEDCFRLLTSGSRAVPSRQRTLRATMDWSHGLLGQEEKILFRRMSAFAGGFTLEAAEAVCAGGGIEEDGVLDLLSRLADKSLVIVARSEEIRYRPLEPVRQYAKEKLDESGEEAEVRDRHAGFFLALAETAGAAMLGSAQEAWVERLEVEHDNLRAALDRGEEAGAIELGLRLAGALWQFWVIRGHFTEGLTRLETLLVLPAASGRSTARAKACYALGLLYYRRGNYAAGDLHKARIRFEESLEISRQLRNEARTAATLTEIGRVATEFGEYDSARSFFEESLMLQRRSGNEHGIALAMNGLGWLDFLRGEHESARRLFGESLATFRELGESTIWAAAYFIWDAWTASGATTARPACGSWN